MIQEKKNACPTVGAAGQAVENGTAYETAHASTTEFTTPPAERQQFRVADFLHPGAESAIPRRQLMALTSMSDRELRLMIEAERRQGCPILSDNIHGYFLPAKEEEREQFIKSMRHRAGEILKSAAAIERGGR